MSFRRKADMVAHELIHTIVRGDVAVGGILPKEELLAVSFGVNRQVVREAMKTLEVYQLVNPVKRRGTEVMDPNRSTSPSVVRAMLTPSKNHIDIELLTSLVEVQGLVEGEMYYMASQRGTDADFRTLEKMLPLLRVAETQADMQRVYIPFYAMVAKTSRNRIFEVLGMWNAEVIDQLRDVLGVSRPNPNEFVDGLAQIIELMKQRKSNAVKEMIAMFYAWYTPRVVAAAKLATNSTPDYTGRGASAFGKLETTTPKPRRVKASVAKPAAKKPKK